MIDDHAAERAKDALKLEITTDGGSDLADYLLDDDPEWDSFETRVEYEVPGEVIEKVDGSKLPKHHAEDGILRNPERQVLRWSEPLGANILQLDAWLGVNWNEEVPQEIELASNRIFLPDWNDTTIGVAIVGDELKKAARERGYEDSKHHCYVLGHWAYLAQKGQHVADESAQTIVDQFDQSLDEAPDAPSDATDDEWGGKVQ